MTNNKTQNWVFLSKTRKWSIYVSIAILALTYLQTYTGKFGDSTYLPSILKLILTLPILLLLWTNRETNRFSGKILSKRTHFIFITLTLIYYLLIFASTLLGSLIYFVYDLSALQSAKNSFFALLPYELTLFWLYYLLLYKGKFQLIPNNDLIREYVDSNLKTPIKTVESYEKFCRECQNLVAKNNLEIVLQKMRDYFENNSKLKNHSTILLQRQFNEVIQQKNIGLVTVEESRVAANRIAFAVLEILDY